jgi:hypothetical protein
MDLGRRRKQWELATRKALLQQLEAGDTIKIFNARKAAYVKVDDKKLLDDIAVYLRNKINELEVKDEEERAELVRRSSRGDQEIVSVEVIT